MNGRMEFLFATLGGIMAMTIVTCPPFRAPDPTRRIPAWAQATPTPESLSRHDDIEDPLKRLNLKLRAIERKLKERGK